MDEQTATLEATESTAVSESAPEATPEPAPATEDTPEVSLDEDGEVTFADSFFGEEKEARPEKEPEPEGPEIMDYSDDELRDTPWEQWDADRITGDVKRYIPIIQEQMRRRAAAQAQFERPAQQIPQPEAPKAPTQKELTAAAVKLAKERLGLGEDDALDFYEPEHVAAMSIAAQEVQAGIKAQTERTQAIAQGQQEFRAFAAEVAARSDFAEFDRWVTAKLATAGLHPNQLQDYIQRTGDYAGAQRTIAGWYQAWTAQKAPKPVAKQVPKVPAVETAQGAVQGKKIINLRDFGDLDEDDQAKALMDAGLI
ncbi:MAG: hypothetical protein IJR68_04725 [Fretibacterium sp.]|nr:hypothetical protein [Fretibacterium sp.]